MLLNAKNIYGKLALAALLAALVGVMAISALAAEKPAPAADYEVREWGVILGCGDGGDYFLTSRPIQITYVKEPVLYFHSRDKRPFSLKVTFNQGTPTETYPAAVKNGNVIQWEHVSFPAKAEPIITKGLTMETLVPFNEIIDTLNKVDADEIESGGTKARFLFYEGEMPFVNSVKMTVDPQSQEVILVNTGSYPILDLFVIVRDPLNAGGFLIQKDIFSSYLPQLQPGETVRLKPELVKATLDFAKPLRELGFTEKEARSFEALWQNSFLNFGKLIYRLPQSECDRMIGLEFDPAPKKISRALYVMVKQ